LEPEFTSQFASAVCDAAKREEVLAAVEGVYAALQARIDQRRPVCVISGKCCHFERYGHLMYVSTMELAAFVASIGLRGASLNDKWDGTGCLFQVGKLCGVHSFRPMGCRVFYCDPTAIEWQRDQYEQFHGELRRLHEQMQVPYFYVEWRQGLRLLFDKGLQSF
jgi:hypothetical protein